MSVPSTSIPGYELIRELGVGGMATVYLAIQRSLDRKVAIKVMKRNIDDLEKFERRFLMEGRTMAKLPHRNIVGGVRHRQERGRHLHRDGVAGRRHAVRPHEGGPVAGRCDLDRGADGAGAAVRARARHRAPRPQAREHHVPRRAHAGADRLRHRQAAGRDADAPDPDRHAGRHADLHEPRADQRARGRRSLRPLQPGRAVLRIADRRAAVRGRHPDRGADGAPDHAGPAAAAAVRRLPAGGRRDAGQEPRRALRQPQGVHPRAQGRGGQQREPVGEAAGRPQPVLVRAVARAGLLDLGLQHRRGHAVAGLGAGPPAALGARHRAHAHAASGARGGTRADRRDAGAGAGPALGPDRRRGGGRDRPRGRRA